MATFHCRLTFQPSVSLIKRLYEPWSLRGNAVHCGRCPASVKPREVHHPHFGVSSDELAINGSSECFLARSLGVESMFMEEE